MRFSDSIPSLSSLTQVSELKPIPMKSSSLVRLAVVPETSEFEQSGGSSDKPSRKPVSFDYTDEEKIARRAIEERLDTVRTFLKDYLMNKAQEKGLGLEDLAQYLSQHEFLLKVDSIMSDVVDYLLQDAMVSNSAEDVPREMEDTTMVSDSEDSGPDESGVEEVSL